MVTSVDNRYQTAPAGGVKPAPPAPSLFDGYQACSFRVTARTNSGSWLPVGVYRLLDDAREFAGHLMSRGWDVEILTEGGRPLPLMDA